MEYFSKLKREDWIDKKNKIQVMSILNTHFIPML